MLFLALWMLSLTSMAQTGLGMIKGKVYNSDSTSVIPYAQVKIQVAGNTIGATTDLEGRYTIDAIPTGTYNITSESTLDGKITITGVKVGADQITDLNVYLQGGIVGEIITVKYTAPKIDINTMTKISSDELKNNIDLRDPKTMITKKSSEVKMDENNNLIIRGSRPGDVVYFVDGIKQTDMQAVPGVAIGGMTLYTGGIPAKYGDTTGGVIILETKSYFDLYYQWLASQP